MLLAFFLAAAALANWAPMRWSSADPKSLEVLVRTPVNCLLLETPEWNPDFIRAASARNIATVGVLHPGLSAVEQAKRATELKMNGVVIEGEYEPSRADAVRTALADTGMIVIELPIRRRMRLDSRDPILGTSQGLWPGIEIEHGGKVMTGPSSAPWINTNTGFLRFVRSATNASLWVGVRPPAGSVYTVERYEIAVSDAAMAGARWIVAFDDDLQRKLMNRDPEAVAAWKQIAAYLKYFEDKPAWRDYRQYSVMAVVQDAESGGMLSSSLLDMLSVQHTAVRAIPTRKLTAESLRGEHIVLNVDAESISAQQKHALEEFVGSGGVLVNPPKGWHFPQTSEEAMVPNRKQMDQIQRMWEITYSATVRKNFGARTFNTSSVLFNVLAKPDGSSVLVHLLNYADFAADTVTVQVLGHWNRARLYQPDGAVQELPVYPVKDGTGVDIDKIPVLATLRME